MPKIPFWLVFTVGLFIRLVLAWFSAEVADTANYRLVAETLQKGGQLYRDTPGIYPYPPVWWLFEISALWLSQNIGGPFVFWAELGPVLADMGIVYLLYLFSRTQSQRATIIPALYALNPLAILICVVHGQFDALPIFFSLLALYLFQTATKSDYHYLRVALVLALAIALKAFPVLLLPFFLLRLAKGRHRLNFAAMALLPVGLLLLPFLWLDATAVGREFFSYSGYPDQGWVLLIWSGLKAFIAKGTASTLQTLLFFSKMLFLLGYVALLYLSYRRHKNLLPASMPGLELLPLGITQTHNLQNGFKWPALTQEIALVFASFYLLYGGLSSQYLLWLLPFVLLLDLEAAIVYTLLASLALLTFYNYQWPGIIYRAQLELLPKTIAAGLWLLSSAVWWVWVGRWLLNRFRFKLRVSRRKQDATS